MQTLSASFEDNVASLNRALRVKESFDLICRTVKVGEDDVALYYVDGFIKDDTMLRIIQYFFTLKGTGDAEEFASRHVPYVEVEITKSVDQIITAVLSGSAVMLSSTFGEKAIIIDARTYPARETAEPESDKVMQGAKDGFVETLIFNTALIRRRIRDPRLTMHYQNLGGGSRTDTVICYVKGLADETYVNRLKNLLSSIKPHSLTLGFQSLAEMLIPRRWYNPFPKIRTVERPDAAAAQLMEGSVLILCDTSPRVMVLPTSILDFLQETDDYYFPPLTGSYQRIVRLFCALTSLLLLPTWYLFLQNPAWLSGVWSNFVPREMGVLPVLAQLLLAELAIDVLKLASMNTPNMLSNSLSIIGGLILGEFAVSVGWLSSDVILYMAITAITAFSQKSQELAYATKFMRILLLLLVALFGIWGYGAGLLLLPLAICSNRTIGDTRTYLAPLIPFRPKALARLLFRLRKKDFERK